MNKKNEKKPKQNTKVFESSNEDIKASLSRLLLEEKQNTFGNGKAFAFGVAEERKVFAESTLKTNNNIAVSYLDIFDNSYENIRGIPFSRLTHGIEVDAAKPIKMKIGNWLGIGETQSERTKQMLAETKKNRAIERFINYYIMTYI